MKNLVSRFVKDESGATAIEYGLIAAGISVAIIAVVQGLGSKLKSTEGSGKPGAFLFWACGPGYAPGNVLNLRPAIC
jgi:pilus assembly protein Flp/PilA